MIPVHVGPRRVAAQLQRAKARIETGWSPAYEAHQADYTPCYADSDNAVAWCPAAAVLIGHSVGSGALDVSLSECSFYALACLRAVVVVGTLRNATFLSGPELIDDIAAWSKAVERTKDEVLRCFDAAIAVAEGTDYLAEAFYADHKTRATA